MSILRSQCGEVVCKECSMTTSPPWPVPDAPYRICQTCVNSFNSDVYGSPVQTTATLAPPSAITASASQTQATAGMESAAPLTGKPQSALIAMPTTSPTSPDLSSCLCSSILPHARCTHSPLFYLFISCFCSSPFLLNFSNVSCFSLFPRGIPRVGLSVPVEWFFGDITRAEAEKLLLKAGSRESDFVLRNSSRVNNLALSVRMHMDGRPAIAHRLITKQKGGFVLESNAANGNSSKPIIFPTGTGHSKSTHPAFFKRPCLAFPSDFILFSFSSVGRRAS